ncbi:MAG: peptidylprolyl isomerase [Oscillospiraceae bacterium]|nr:peptidylprolyl isomerase [Oscillospiraceae bacterium]
MKCKFCLAEVEDDVTVCPVCGKALEETEDTPAEETVEETVEEVAEETAEETAEEVTEETEEVPVMEEVPTKKKSKALVVTLAALGGLVLAAALVIAVLYGMGYKLSDIGAFLGLKEAGPDYKNNYSVSDQKMEQAAKEVIAKVGDQTLTNEQLQVYYWLTVQDYVYQYEYAISMGADTELGFDLKKPLSEQVYDLKTGKTFEQFFLENALESWRRYASFVQLSQDVDFKLSKDIQDFLDGYKEDLEAAAKENGYADAEAYVDAQVSKGSSADAYFEYVSTQYKALGYLQSKEPELAPTEKEMEDYYKAHEKDLADAGYGKSAGKYYDVRHIFVTVQGEMGEKGYTDAQWEECRAKAQKLLDDFLANEPTEQKFAELAMKNSEDPGSAANGGLYANLTKNYGFIKEFEDWYTDESRKPGDTGIVKNTGSSKVGYHVMYFSAAREIWKDQVETLILSEKMGELLEQTKETYPMTVNYKNIVLGKADLVTETK